MHVLSVNKLINMITRDHLIQSPQLRTSNQNTLDTHYQNNNTLWGMFCIQLLYRHGKARVQTLNHLLIGILTEMGLNYTQFLSAP